MKPNNRSMDTKECRRHATTPLNDDTEQQPDCSDYSVGLTSDPFTFSEDGDDGQAVKRTRHTSKKECKDRIKNDIQEIRSLLPPLYASDMKQTNHELLQNAISFIRVLIAQNKEMTSCLNHSQDVDYDKLRGENEELKTKNKQYRNILEAVGLPENVNPSLLEVSWKLRDVTATSDVCVFDSLSVATSDSHVIDSSLEPSVPAGPDEGHSDQPEDHIALPQKFGLKQESIVPEMCTAEVSDVREDVYESRSIADDSNTESVAVLDSSKDKVQDSFGVVVSSTENQPVFMSPDSGSDRQVEMEKTISHLPPSQSNGNLSDISEPASDTEGTDPPLLTVGQLTLENAFRQSAVLDLGGEGLKSSEAAFKVNDQNHPLGLLQGSVVSMTDDESQRYLQMMQQVSFPMHLSNSVESVIGLSSSSHFGIPSTCPISPSVSETPMSVNTSNQVNNVMMLHSGQLLLVSPQQNSGSNVLQASEAGVASLLPSAGTNTIAVHPARQENGLSLQHQQQPGLFTTNFSLHGVNQGLTLGTQGVNGMPAMSANNTVFMNPSVQYGVNPQPMTFISGGQPSNVLPLIQPSCPPVNLAMTQNPAMTVSVPQAPVALNALQQPTPQNQHPSALILPNGQIVPVVTQPNLLFGQQQCTPVTGGLLVPSVQTPNLNIIGNVQNPPSQLRFGSNLLPTSTIQPTQVITNIANIRGPAYGLLQNTNQNHQQQYQLVGNSLQPIANMNGSGILLSQPRPKESFTLKNVATSLPGLALPQTPGQFTLLPGNCINALTSQHMSNSGMYGGSCSTTVSTTVPLLPGKPNVFGSSAALPNIPATLTAMLTPEGSIILAIPGCRDSELVISGTGQAAANKVQKVTQRPLMPKPASKLDAVSQLTSVTAPGASSKTCPSMMTCEFGSPGTAISVTSSSMVPLTVNTTNNVDFSCLLSGPGSTTSSTDILAKATKSIFSISPYENLSPRSLFNSGICDNLLTFSSSGLAQKNDSSHAECKPTTPLKLKRSKPKPKAKSVKKKSPKSVVCATTALMPDVCHHIVQSQETEAAAEMSPNEAIVEQLTNDEEVSDINDFSDLIRMEPMTPVTLKATAESEMPTACTVEKHEVPEARIVMDDLIETCDKSVLEMRRNSGIGENGCQGQEFHAVSSQTEELPGNLKDAVPCIVSSTSSHVVTESYSVVTKASWTPDTTVDVSTATKEVLLSNDVETTSCREVGTSTERKRKKHKKQKSRADPDVNLPKDRGQTEIQASSKLPRNGAADKGDVAPCTLKTAFCNLAPNKENEDTQQLTVGTGKNCDDLFSSKYSGFASVANTGSGDRSVNDCPEFQKKIEGLLSKRQETCISQPENKSEGALPMSKTQVYGACHNKDTLGKKFRKRLHRSSCVLKPDMLPDMLTFTESELLDVVDKVENMMMTDEREMRKRSHDRIKVKEPTPVENVCRKKAKCDRATEAGSGDVCDLAPEASDQLPWPEVTPPEEVSPGLNNGIVMEMPDCLPEFEIEEEMAGFSVAPAFSSHSLTPEERSKKCHSAASPVFSLELVVPDSVERPPDRALSECSENVMPESSQCCIEELTSMEVPKCGLACSVTQPLLNSKQQLAAASDKDSASSSLACTESPVSSAACTSGQARHSGIVSLAKQVAPSKPHGTICAGVQPRAVATKNVMRISQGNTRIESDSVVTSSNSSTTRASSVDTYGENMFSAKDRYLPSSKDLGIDFSFELDSKDKTSPCDVTSGYDWVLTDPEPQTSTSLDISSPNSSENQKSFDCELELKTAGLLKAGSAIADNVADGDLPSEAAVQTSSNHHVPPLTQATSSHLMLPSLTYYTSPSKPSDDHQQAMPGYSTATTKIRTATPSTTSHQIMSTVVGVASSDISFSHGRNTAGVVASGKTATCTTSIVATLNHPQVIPSSNFPARTLSCHNHSPLSVTPNVSHSSALNHKTSSSMAASVTCTMASMKTTTASCSSSSRNSCSQKSLESHIRLAALPHDSSLSASSYRSNSNTERVERLSCSKEGPMRTNSVYFGASSHMSTSSSCAVQGKSLDDPFHYHLPPYILNSSREYSQVGGSLSRYSSTANCGMLSSSNCTNDYNTLARYSLYFSSPFTHDLGLDMSHQRMSPNRGLPSCSIEKHPSVAKVGSAGSNRLNVDSTKSCQTRHQDDGYTGFSGSSLMLSHNSQEAVHCSNQFLEPRTAVSHSLIAHNRDSSSVARANQRLSTGMQNTSTSRSRSSTRSPTVASEHSASFGLHAGYTGTSVASSLASPPLHHHSVATDRHCLGQQLGYDLSFHTPTIQTFSPNLNGVGFDPPALNFSRDCGNTSSPQTQTKKTGKKTEENAGSVGSKMILNHSKQQQSSGHQSQQQSKSTSGSGRSSRVSKKTGKTSAYDADSSMYESRSVTPYLGLGNMSPNLNFPTDGLAYMNFFSNTSRPLSNAGKTLHHRDPPAPMSHPFNSSFFPSSRTQNGLGLNFQTGFPMDHMNTTHITSSQMIIPHSGAISAHMHSFGFFPDISGSMVQREALNNMSSMKFGHGTILPTQGTVEPSPLHHPQTQGGSAYNSRGQLPSHMLHDMGFNALLGGHQHPAFDARSISGGMVHSPFAGHSHGASFGMGPLNFPVHNL